MLPNTKLKWVAILAHGTSPMAATAACMWFFVAKAAELETSRQWPVDGGRTSRERQWRKQTLPGNKNIYCFHRRGVSVDLDHKTEAYRPKRSAKLGQRMAYYPIR